VLDSLLNPKPSDRAGLDVYGKRICGRIACSVSGSYRYDIIVTTMQGRPQIVQLRIVKGVEPELF